MGQEGVWWVGGGMVRWEEDKVNNMFLHTIARLCVPHVVTEASAQSCN